MALESASTPEKHNEAGMVIPALVMGSPSDLPAPPPDALGPEFSTLLDGEVPFWRPGVLDVARGIGIQWIILLPALEFCLLVPLSPIIFWRGGILGVLGPTNFA